MFGKRIAATVSSFSLFLAFAGAAGTYRDLDARLKRAEDRAAVEILVQETPPDSPLYGAVESLRANPKSLADVREMVAQRAVAEAAFQAKPDLAAKVKARKAANPLYRDDPTKQTGNWIAKAYERLGEAIRRLLNRPSPRVSAPNIPPIFGPWIVYLLWGILGAALLAFLYFALRHFSWRKRLSRKTAMLDEAEPERSLDEWLGLADQLEREGKYREAIRCLYIASLLKFDEHRVARFDRGQTNWEHNARIRQSPNRPAGLDFDDPTSAFDRVWYGMRVEGKDDVDRFRAWYKAVVDALKAVPA